MEGSAGYWFRFWKEKLSWEGLKEALVRRFGGRDRGTMFERLTVIKQRATVNEYVQDFEMLVGQIKGVSEDQLLGYLFVDLQEDIRSQIRPQNPKELMTVMEVARDVEEAHRGSRTGGENMAKNQQSWGRYQGSVGTIARPEPARNNQGRQGNSESEGSVRKEGTLGNTPPKVGSTIGSYNRG